ncbi:MAG: TlyA family RNA methyltransferase [Actinomycetota bacterium]
MSSSRVDQELVRRRLARSRAEARDLIDRGLVLIDGSAASKPSQAVKADALVEILDGPRYVSRAGAKLAAAIEAFGIVAQGRSCLDVGASTGGFTDCLLRHGARRVVAVDVGVGQMAAALSAHQAVTVLENTDIRSLQAADGPFDLVAVDLSFISVCAVAATLAELVGAGGDVVVLVKPQFEVGRERIGRGVVRKPEWRIEAIAKVEDCLSGAGLDTLGVMESPVTGERGNQEYLLWARPRNRG